MYASLGRTSGMMTRQNLGERLFMRLNRIAQVTVLLLIPAILSNSLAYAASRPPDAAAVKEKIAARGVGQKVRVTLADKTEAKGMIVSIGDQSFVFVAMQSGAGFIAHQLSVKLGEPVGNTYPVLAGLNPGDRVILSGTQFLQEGMPVMPLGPSAGASAATAGN